MEVFANIESQIERAVQLGQDSVIQALDSEIDPVLQAILSYRARNTEELQKQLKFITDLLVRRSDDAATVVRLSAKLSEMISHYFQDGQIQLREDRAGSGIRITPMVQPASTAMGAAQEIARVAVISAEYRFLYCNSVMSDDLRQSPRELVGRPVLDHCDQSVFDTAYRPNLDMCLAGDFREFYAACLTGKNGSPNYYVRLTPLRNIERRITGAVMVAQSGRSETGDLGH